MNRIRRQREPPSTGYNYFNARRRKPVDPPSTFEAPRTNPEIRLSERQLEIVRQRTGNDYDNNLRPPLDPSDHGAPTFAQLIEQEKQERNLQQQEQQNLDIVDENDNAGSSHVSFDESTTFHKHSSDQNVLVDEEQPKQEKVPRLPGASDQNASAGNVPSSIPFSTLSNKSMSNITASGSPTIPFSTLPNQEVRSKSLVLASSRLKKKGSRSLFSRKHNKDSNESDTVASRASAKSAATNNFSRLTTNNVDNKSSEPSSVAAAPVNGRKLSTESTVTTASSRQSGSAGIVVSAKSSASNSDKLALRKILLEKEKDSETKEIVLAAPSSSSNAKSIQPSSTKVPPSVTTSTAPGAALAKAPSSSNEIECQRDYIRSLMSRNAAIKTANVKSSNVTSKELTNSALKIHGKSSHDQESIKSHAQKTPSMISNSVSSRSGTDTRTKSDTSSSLASDLSRKILASTRKKLSPKHSRGAADKSPRSDSSRWESAGGALARNLADPTRIRSPKKDQRGFTGYVARKMFPTKKSTRTNKTTAEFGPKIGNSFSVDSSESAMEASSLQSMSQVATFSTDASDDDKTRTTLASSSNLSDDTKHTHDSSLKQLSTAKTIDTDESSTIMGNLQSASSDSMQYSHLQSASSDSMQYSSEEGCEDTSVLDNSAFQAIDKISSVSSVIKGRPGMPNGSTSAARYYNTTIRPHDKKTKRASPSKLQLVRISQSSAGFNKFVTALKLETSGAHSQLWSSFQSVMTGSLRKFPPIHSSDPHFKFDSATKEMLGTMNLHLKRQALVECAVETQLVNDKKYAKEAEAVLGRRTFHPERTQPSYFTEKKGLQRENQVVRVVNKELPGVRDVPAPTNAGNERMDNAEQSPPLSMGHRELSGINEKQGEREVATIQRFDTGKKALLQEDSSRQKNENGNKFVADTASKTLGTDKPQAIKTILDSKQNNVQPLLSATQNESTIPWAGMRLRPVSSQLDNDSTGELPAGQNKTSTMPSPWKKVVLRRVPDEDNEASTNAIEEQNQMQDNDELCIDGVLEEQEWISPSQALSSPKHEKSTCSIDVAVIDRQTWVSPSKSTRSATTTGSNDTTNNGVERDSGKTSVPRRRSSIHKLKTPTLTVNTEEPCVPVAGTVSRENIEKSAVVFDLKRETGTSVADQEKVAIGKKMVMTLQTKPGESTAKVTWSIPRDRIKALKLDMESQRVNLSLVDDVESKVLSFPDSTDCLKFANAFYEMLKPSEQRGMHQSLSQDTATDTNNQQQRLESLNDEEQKVLETYRQVRRTKPPIDAIRAVVPATEQNIGTAIAHTNPMNSILSSITSLRKTKDPDDTSNEEGKQSNGSTQDSIPPLSADELKVAQSYQKMLKLKIPPEAVEHKMTKENVDPKIIGFVLGEAGMLASDTNYPDELSDSERKVVMLYKNMLKLMVPPDTVRNKMKEDNVDDKIVFAVLGKDKVEGKTLENTAARLSEAEEAIAASYRKMLKMMIPKEAVKHRMIKDQIDPKIMVVVVGSDASSVKKDDKLSQSEEATAATYRKMLKLQMPRDAVRHRMEKDGVSEKIIKAVLGRNNETGTNKGDKKPTSTNANQGGSNLVSLHWTPLSGKELDNSVWRATKKRKPAKTQPEGSDISKLVELFQKKSTAKVAKGKANENSDHSTGKAKLIDLNRANNVAISLKAFKDFSYEQLAEILQNIDPSRKLRGERVQFVRDLLPTSTEVDAIKRYYGSTDRLVPAEKWFQKIVHIKRLEEKAHVLHTMEVFEAEVLEVRKSLHLLSRVCNQVMESERLRELLDMVLQIGNIMNEGTRTGGASGFKFDSLLRLTQTKSGDGKTTVLDYMVTIYAAKGQKEILNLMENFPECQMASRMLISDLVANVKDISDKLQKCKKEYNALVAEASGKNESSIASLQKNLLQKSSAASDTRLHILSAVTSRGVADPRETASEVPSGQQSSGYLKKNEILNAVNSSATSKDAPAVGDLLKAIKSIQSTDSDAVKKSPRRGLLVSQHGVQESTESSASNKDVPGNKASGLHAGIARLNDFLGKAELTYNGLKLACDTAVETCREMSKYCGESGGERATDGLLGILSEFASSLEAAVKKHDRIMEAEAKKLSRQAATPKKVRRRPEDLHRGSSPSRKSSPSTKSKHTTTTEAHIKGGPNASETTNKRPDNGRSQESSVPRGKGTSLVLMVNELLKEADEQIKKDFSQGIVYENPDDKLKAIYEREKKPPLPKGRRSVDGDLMTTIQKRQGEADGRAKRTQLERVIDCINCASGAVAGIDESENETSSVSASVASSKSETPSSDQQTDKFKNLQSMWQQCKTSKGENRNAGVKGTNQASEQEDSSGFQEDEGSVQKPIDCTAEDWLDDSSESNLSSR